jgi:3-oxoacyl-[acyl-carrier protein] reductase
LCDASSQTAPPSWALLVPARRRGYEDEHVTEFLEELRASGGRVEHVNADLADPDAPARLVAAAREAFGRLDIVVANHARSSGVALEDLTAAEIDLTFAVNTRGTLLLIKEFAAHHDGQTGARVLLFTSGQYHGAMHNELPYITSKPRCTSSPLVSPLTLCHAASRSTA